LPTVRAWGSGNEGDLTPVSCSALAPTPASPMAPRISADALTPLLR
jgi:hypothetical protein